MSALVRILFVLGPALLLGGPLAFFSLGEGIIVFAATAWLGWHVTAARPERGEGRALQPNHESPANSKPGCTGGEE